MPSPVSPTRTAPAAAAPQLTSAGPSVDSEITWLLHRAAQRMHATTGQHAARYGLQLRDYIVLSALTKTPDLTQSELGHTLGLDKTTLMSQLDSLERKGLATRRSQPGDRRVRIPEITPAGAVLQATVAGACATAEAAALHAFSQDQVNTFRRILVDIIGTSTDPGSCL